MSSGLTVLKFTLIAYLLVLSGIELTSPYLHFKFYYKLSIRFIDYAITSSTQLTHHLVVILCENLLINIEVLIVAIIGAEVGVLFGLLLSWLLIQSSSSLRSLEVLLLWRATTLRNFVHYFLFN